MSDGYNQEKEARSIDALNKFVGVRSACDTQWLTRRHGRVCLQQDTNAMYTFDAPAGVPRAELCRGKNCVTVRVSWGEKEGEGVLTRSAAGLVFDEDV